MEFFGDGGAAKLYSINLSLGAGELCAEHVDRRLRRLCELIELACCLLCAVELFLPGHVLYRRGVIPHPPRRELVCIRNADGSRQLGVVAAAGSTAPVVNG